MYHTVEEQEVQPFLYQPAKVKPMPFNLLKKYPELLEILHFGRQGAQGFII